MGKGELDFGVDHVEDCWATGTNTNLLTKEWTRNDARITNLNRSGACTMTGRHLSVQLLDGTAQRGVTVLFVHVVAARARVVAQRNTVDIDNVGVLLDNLTNSKNITRRLLHLAVLMEKVPEARLGLDWSLGKDLHAVDLRCCVVLGWGLATGDLVVVNKCLCGSHDVVMFVDELHFLSKKKNFVVLCEWLRDRFYSFNRLLSIRSLHFYFLPGP